MRQEVNRTALQNVKKKKDLQNQTVQPEDFNKENISQGFLQNRVSNSNSQSINGIKNQAISQNSRKDTQTVIQKKQYDTHLGEIEGLSFSSFSSNERHLNNKKNTVKAQIKKTKSQWVGSIAEQLSKNYFLNSQQLLRHLSPERVLDKNEAPSALLGNGSQQGRIQSGLSASSQQRGRNRSQNAKKTNVRPKVINQNQNVSNLMHRKSNSLSQPRKQKSKNHDGVRKSTSQTRKDLTQDFNGAFTINSPIIQNVNYTAQVTKKSNQLNFQFKSNKNGLDKLIKKNIRKNKNKLQEEYMKKEIEEMKQKQRKVELTQRNQEVRQINASKINNKGDLTHTVFFNVQKKKIDSCLDTAQNKEVQSNDYNKRRSQSCIEGTNIPNQKRRNQSSSGEKKNYVIKKSNDKLKSKNETNLNTKENTQREVQNQVIIANKKQIPNTTTNNFGGKPRSFVDEIKQITQQVEKEISQDSVRNAESGIKRKYLITASATTKANKYIPQSAKNMKVNNEDYSHNLNQYSKKIEDDQQQKFEKQIQKQILEDDLKSKRVSIELQRFIEKKKRIQQIQKELEQTIEVGKQIKIQNNLSKLQKFVKKSTKHTRQRSQPAALKHKMMNSSNLGLGTSKMQTMKRKSKKIKGTAPQTIMNMAEIFNYNFPPQSVQNFNEQQDDSKYLTQERKQQSHQGMWQTKAQTSNQPTKKSQNLDKPFNQVQQFQRQLNNDSSDLLKNQVLYSDNNNKRVSVQDKNIQEKVQIVPHLHKKAQSININTHPFQEQTQVNPQKQVQQKVRQKQKKQIQVSPQRTEQIRRVHELVALYRCRFKQNASDAAVMGTLHSAASVIQIHFRYRKHLKQAEIQKKLNFQQINQSQSSMYIQTDEQREINENKLSNRFHQFQNVQEFQFNDEYIQDFEGIEDNYSGFLMNTNNELVIPKKSDYIDTSDKSRANLEESNSLQVFLDSKSNAQKLKDILNEQEEISQKEIVIESNLYNKRNDNKSNLDPKNDFSELDIDTVGLDKRPSTVAKTIKNKKNNKQHSQNNNTQKTENQNSSKGNRTPIIPGLDFNKLKINTSIQVDEPVSQVEQPKEKKNNQQILVIDAGQIIPTTQNQNEKILQTDQQQTSSSYSGIFNRMGLPISRSARVKVDYDLVQKDPKISEQLKELINHKNKIGIQVIEEGRKMNLITERTYDINCKKLEKWVTSSYNRINANQNDFSSSTRKHLHNLQTNDDLLKAAEDERNRMQKIIHNYNLEGNPKQSGRSIGQSTGRRPFQKFDEKDQAQESDPYSNIQYNNQKIGSSRGQNSLITKMINNDSSHSAQDNIKIQSNSNSGNDIDHLNLDEIQINLSKKDNLIDSNNISEIKFNKEGTHNKTEKSLNRSQSYPAISLNIGQKSIINQNIDQLNEDSETSEQNKINQGNNQSSKIQDELEIALFTAQQKEFISQNIGQDYNELFQQTGQSNIEDAISKIQDSNILNKEKKIENIRDPKFFINQIDDESNSKDNGSLLDSQKDKKKIRNYNEELNDDYSQLNNYNDNNNTRESINANSTLIDSFSKGQESTSPNQAIKVENQLVDSQMQSSNFKHDSSLFDSHLDNSHNKRVQDQKGNFKLEQIPDSSAPGHPVSPVSDSQASQNQAFEFKITTGAHSLSSTDSDITKAIRQANKEVLDSPPNVLSPTNPGFSQINSSLLKVVDEQDQQQQEMNDISTIITEYLLLEILQELKTDMDVIIPRVNLMAHRQVPLIKFFEKKGIKTDLFAIEKYVDEILDEVKEDRLEFMAEINRSIGKNEIQLLYQMQNSEIGSFEHFQPVYPPVLALDLYLKLEKRRKDSRDPQVIKETGNPDGRFDFENVTEEDLLEDRVDKNFLAECQYIHNKILFDCINDSLQQFRPFGKDGKPMQWSKLGRKLKPTEDFTLEEMFEITKHDLFRMAIMQAGTLPRREFVFGGQFDEELFNELREKKLATLLCREIVETEHQWLKWDFEEAQTKIDLADMVLESLVTETIEFLNKKKKESSSMHAQIQFEEIQQMIQSRI